MTWMALAGHGLGILITPGISNLIEHENLMFDIWVWDLASMPQSTCWSHITNSEPELSFAAL